MRVGLNCHDNQIDHYRYKPIPSMNKTRPSTSQVKRKGGLLAMDINLHALVEGCRSVSWTQKAGYQCSECSHRILNYSPACRLEFSAFLLKLNATRQNLAGVCLSTLQAYAEWSEKEVFEVWRAVILT